MLLYAQNAGDWDPSGIHPRAPFILDIYEWYQRSLQKIIPILYADDTGLVSSLCSFYDDKDKYDINEMSRDINDELSCVQEWLNINKLSLNVSKTEYMIFHHRQRNIDEFIPDIRINDSPIERVTDFNFLGLQIDQHLSWNAHIQKVLIKSLVLWESWIVLNDIYQLRSSVFYTIR